MALMSVGLAACGPATTEPPAAVPAPDAPAIVGSGSSISFGLRRPGLTQVLEEAQKGNEHYQFELGAMYHDGDGVGRDFAQAINWYRKAAEQGNRMAAFNLGLMMKNGEGTAANLDAARSWFARAAEAGDARAANQLGLMAYTGDGMARDDGAALQYFTKAALGSLAEAQLNAAILYIRAEGVAQDLVEGYAWLTMSKRNGWERAGTLLDQLVPKLSDEQKEKGDARVAEMTEEIRKLDAERR